MTEAFPADSTAFRTRCHIYHIRDKQPDSTVSFPQQTRELANSNPRSAGNSGRVKVSSGSKSGGRRRRWPAGGHARGQGLLGVMQRGAHTVDHRQGGHATGLANHKAMMDSIRSGELFMVSE